MITSHRRQAFTAGAVVALLVVPVVLFWYGAKRCQELSCIGPPVNAFLQLVTVVPLLALWRARRRAIYPAMLTCAEVAMAVVTLGQQFDFSPQFMVIAIPVGLLVGLVIGLAAERPGNEHG